MPAGIEIRVSGIPDPTFPSPSEVEVWERIGQATEYRLRYGIDISDGDFPMLTESRLGPGADLSLLAGSGCLVKGPVYGQRILLKHGGEGSTLEVLGADSSIKMDRESKAAIWDGMRDSDAVSTILAQYALTPDVEQTQAMHLGTKHALVQRESDLGFVRRLARRNGFLFWITTDDMGIETAHFKKPPLQGSPGTELGINVNPASLGELEISWDVERPVSTEVKQLDLNNKSPIDGSVQQSTLAPLGSQGLSAIATETRLIHMAAPADDAGELMGRSEGALLDAGFFVRAMCKTTVQAVGSVVRSHTLVTLSGAGSRHSGTYLCSSVRHVASDTAHRMEIELIRNGWES